MSDQEEVKIALHARQTLRALEAAMQELESRGYTVWFEAKSEAAVYGTPHRPLVLNITKSVSI